MSTIGLLASSNYIIINRDVLKKVGIDAAVMLSELADEERYYSESGMLDDGWFYSTVENVTSRTGFTKRRQRNGIDELRKDGLIEFEVRGMPAKRYFRINPDAIQDLIIGQQVGTQWENKLERNVPTSCPETCQQVVPKRARKNNYIKEYQTKNNKEKNSPAGPDSTIDAEVLEVVSYLNEKANKNFGARSKSTEKFIKGRLNDGATVEEMKAVIDRKVAQWKDDPKMNQFLRPKTLFNETNYESYRNESDAKQNHSYLEIYEMMYGKDGENDNESDHADPSPDGIGVWDIQG